MLRLLATRGFCRVAVLCGLLLALPSIGGGLLGDDVRFQLVLRGESGIEGLDHGLHDLFVFATGEEQYARTMQDLGIFPWWAEASAKVAFLRPVSALTHWLDARLWPQNVPLMHLHSLLWFALLLFLVGSTYRRFFGASWTAGLALLLFCIDDAHGTPAGWLANRYGLIAMALSLPVLDLHDRWRRGGRTGAGFFAPLLLALALMAGESALAICAYLFAHALFLDRGSRRARLLALAPYGAVVLVWRLAWDALGYGAAHSTVYLDPLQEGLGFLGPLAERLPILLAAQFWLPASDLAMFYTPLQTALVAAGGVLVMAIGLFLGGPILARDPLSRFWLVGLLLAALPICATSPSDRSLLFVGLGAMGLVAQLLTAWVARPAWLEGSGPRRRLTGIACLALVLMHLVIAPLLLPFRARLSGSMHRAFTRAMVELPSDPGFGERTLVLVNPPSEAHTAYLHPAFEWEGRQRPARIRELATGVTDIELLREDERTLLVQPRDGFWPTLREQLLVDPDRARQVGEAISLPPVSIEITRVSADGRASQARFRFDVPLEDPSLDWFHWENGRFVRFTPPAPGERRILPRIRLRDLLKSGR